ncbi:MAG TPA: PIN domain-containing protein [Pirellulales bacterium]
MALICDTGGIYAVHDADDLQHAAVKEIFENEPGPLFLPAVLLAEIDYLLTRRLGVDAALDFIDSIERGAFTLVVPTAEDIARCRELMIQYRDLPLGIADASVVAAAERMHIQRILTVDERHFRAVRPRLFSHFVLLPADHASR